MRNVTQNSQYHFQFIEVSPVLFRDEKGPCKRTDRKRSEIREMEIKSFFGMNELMEKIRWRAFRKPVIKRACFHEQDKIMR